MKTKPNVERNLTMKAKKKKPNGCGNRVKESIQRLINHPAGQNPISGFCICPHCKHLVFDAALTGNCPYCGEHFCAACITNKIQN